ncbi:helix-turn-helix domain-containing protein [Actinocorallia lasiicapitis]
MWDSEPLRRALARADMGAVVAVLRGATGLSQLQFGELLGWSQTMVYRIERGERRTANDIGQILGMFDALGMPREALFPLVLGRVDVAVDSDEEVAFWGTGVSEDVDRRHFNRLMVGTAVGVMIPAPERVDRGHVRYLHSCLDQLRARDRAAGGGGLLAEAVRVYERARLMLDESAERAAEAARHDPSPTLHALIALRQALAYAALDDEFAFRSSINQARRELDRGRRADELPWTAFVSHSEITGYEAMGAMLLDSPAKAAELYQVVLNDPARSPRDRAYYRACLSGALAQSGDQGAAVSEALTVLPELHGRGLTSVRVLQALDPVRKAMPDGDAFTVRYDAAAKALAAATA